ncbi:MAG: transcriptional regulator [Spirochaetales bacterium]|nr:MAG: transcriptional regulator [Spirochaetales bacterium]
MNKDKIELSNNIRQLRFFAGEMTQAALAEKAGVSRQTIMAIEAGKYSPSLELAFAVADVFGIGIEEVFSHTVKNEAKGREDT